VGREGEVLAGGVLTYGLVVRDAWVRWVDALTGEELPLLREELAQGRREADLRRTAQEEARIELERRLAAEATAREELQRRLAAEAGQRAAEGRAAAEAAARLVAEEEITRLRRALERRSEFDDAR